MNKNEFISKWKYRSVEGKGICDSEKELISDLENLTPDYENLKEAVTLLQEVKDGYLNPTSKIDKAISIIKESKLYTGKEVTEMMKASFRAGKRKMKCECHNEIKTGQTSVMCCNICGKPDETFWTNEPLSDIRYPSGD